MFLIGRTYLPIRPVIEQPDQRAPACDSTKRASLLRLFSFTWNHRVSLDILRENATFNYQFYAIPSILTNKMADTKETTP